MRSGELARLTAISTDTLRHYERLGLLPKPPRTAGGYRDYPPQARDRVCLIRRALSVGFSLAELKAILGMRDRGEFPCHEARKIASSKLVEVKRQIKDLAAMRGQLEAMLKDWDTRLARAGKGRPARLLESVAEGLPQVEGKTRFNQKHRKRKS